VQSPTEIDTSAAIGWFHTISLNVEREKNITKKEVGQDCNRDDPDQEPRRQRGQKEFPHLSLGTRIPQNHASFFPANTIGLESLQE
jgi:hypothetical protein